MRPVSKVSTRATASLLLLLAIAAALAFALISGILFPTASQGSNSTNDGKLQVTASFYPLFYFAQIIGGKHADVHNITPAGAEPHDYEPTTQDIARIERGDLLILNGGLEPWGDKIRAEVQGTKLQVVIAGQGLLSQRIVEAGQTAQDPHVWLSPPLAKLEVGRILDGFSAVDSANRDDYNEQAKLLEDELDQLDAAFRSGLSNCRRRDFVTSHTAFAYLAQAYELNQVSIAGLSPDSEPSARQLADIADLAKEKQIRFIFFESLVSPRLSETIAEEVGAKTLVLDPIEGLTDEQIRQGKSYFTVMRDNLANLQTALQCIQ